MKLRHKFNAVSVHRDNYRFSSKKEARRYDELILLKRSGDVLFFMMQPPFYMPGAKYVGDFLIFWADGTVTLEDVKGVRTPTFIMKKKMMAIHYPHIEIEEI